MAEEVIKENINKIQETFSVGFASVIALSEMIQDDEIYKTLQKWQVKLK